jgi:Protein of unknown function (DUF3303)
MLLSSRCANIQTEVGTLPPEKGEKEVMRFMLKFTFPTTTETNAWVRDGTIRQKMEATLEALQPEAAYFAPTDGTRSGYWIINSDEASEIPPKVEPFFQELGATVEIFPVMTAEDLGAGRQQRYG